MVWPKQLPHGVAHVHTPSSRTIPTHSPGHAPNGRVDLVEVGNVLVGLLRQVVLARHAFFQRHQLVAHLRAGWINAAQTRRASRQEKTAVGDGRAHMLMCMRK